MRGRRSVRRATANRLQALLRRGGFELSRPTPPAEAVRRAKLIANERIDLVLDVGANVGGYAHELRLCGYAGKIVSFEPLSSAFARLEWLAAEDPTWSVTHLALGEHDGSAEINIAANSLSSSLLPMGRRHLDSAPESAYVGQEKVRSARLDSIWDEVVGGAERPWLKLDVQGYEMHVLRGAGERLDEVHAVQPELSLVPLYEGDTPWRYVVDWLGERGFCLAGVEPGFEAPDSGRMLQFDGIFIRS
jgi:FkbM family methyltransferase